MAVWDGQCVLKIGDGTDQIIGILRVFLHDLPLGAGKFPFFKQDIIRDADLSYIM